MDSLTQPEPPEKAPRRTLLSDVPPHELRQRVLLALSILQHRDDGSDVVLTMVRRALLGDGITDLSAVLD